MIRQLAERTIAFLFVVGALLPIFVADLLLLIGSFLVLDSLLFGFALPLDDVVFFKSKFKLLRELATRFETDKSLASESELDCDVIRWLLGDE